MGDPAEKVYDDAMKLPASERRTIALRLLASVPGPEKEAPQPAHRPTASWATIESLRGVVHFGGNALEDCDRLYDG
jgi:hypothetical protein